MEPWLGNLSLYPSSFILILLCSRSKRFVDFLRGDRQIGNPHAAGIFYRVGDGRRRGVLPVSPIGKLIVRPGAVRHSSMTSSLERRNVRDRRNFEFAKVRRRDLPPSLIIISSVSA